MKNRIINFKYSIISLIMILLNGVEVYASTPWTVNPSDFRYDMSLYFDVTLASTKMDYSKYVVGAFYGEECRGIAERLPLNDGEECLYLRVRSNQETGENITFKYYNNETEEILPIEGVSFVFESNERLGYPSEPYDVKIVRYYDVILDAGLGGAIDQQGGRIAEGTEITITAIPAEGYHFEKWSDDTTANPRTIVINGDITLSADFAVNTYKLVYMVDGAVYKEDSVDFGTILTPESYPVKEGHTFSGWDGLPETMPARDVTVSGVFTVNSYNAVFKIDDEVIDTVVVVYGEPVVAPEAPVREGYTFGGWQDVPDSMPAKDIVILGSYTVNSYKLVYLVDGAVYKEDSVVFGTVLTPESYPVKEGHTFSGWDGLPETMPARDVTVSGVFTVNSYTLRLYLNNELYHSEIIEFGSPIFIEDPIVPEGMKFDGWVDDIPETMPAHDVNVYGTCSAINSIGTINSDYNTKVTICTLNGQVLYKNVNWHKVKDELVTGIYIVNGVKYLIRK